MGSNPETQHVPDILEEQLNKATTEDELFSLYADIMTTAVRSKQPVDSRYLDAFHKRMFEIMGITKEVSKEEADTKLEQFLENFRTVMGQNLNERGINRDQVEEHVQMLRDRKNT